MIDVERMDRALHQENDWPADEVLSVTRELEVPKVGRQILSKRMKMLCRTAVGVSYRLLVYLRLWVTTPHLLILSFILVVALTLGVIGLDHGLPYFPDVDEFTKVRSAARIAATHYPNPGWFGHPGSTIIYPLAFIYKLWGSIVYQIPVWQTNPNLFTLLQENPVEAEHFETDWAIYYLIGRWLSLLYFVASIGMTYLVGVRVWGRRVALLAVWFMAISPILIDHAQVVRTDHAGVFFFMLAFLACFRLLSSRQWCNYLVAGVAIGLAGSSRYFNLSLGATLILAHFLSGAYQEKGHWRRLTIGLGAIGLGFIITTPAFIFSLERVYQNLRAEARQSLVPLTLPEKLWWYLSFALPGALTWPIWLLAIGGMFLTWHKRNKQAILLLFGFVMFLLTIMVPALYWQRWIIPLIPIGLLFAAKALWTGVDVVTEHKPERRRWTQSAAILLIIILSIIPLKETGRHTYLMTQPDTRILAAQWIEANLPAGSKIAREWYTPLIPGEGISVTYRRFLYQLGPFDETLGRQYDYLVASSYAYDIYLNLANRRPEDVASYAEPVKFYQKLFANEPVAEFKPDPWKTPGPTIRVYKIHTESNKNN